MHHPLSHLGRELAINLRFCALSVTGGMKAGPHTNSPSAHWRPPNPPPSCLCLSLPLVDIALGSDTLRMKPSPAPSYNQQPIRAQSANANSQSTSVRHKINQSGMAWRYSRQQTTFFQLGHEVKLPFQRLLHGRDGNWLGSNGLCLLRALQKHASEWIGAVVPIVIRYPWRLREPSSSSS